MSRHERLTPLDTTPETKPSPEAAPKVEPLAAPTEAATAAAPAQPANPPAKKSRKKAVLGLIALVALGAAGYEGTNYWTTGRFMVETNDAYVDADVALISSRIQGYVTELAVTANQKVKAGDVLVRLDDGDYRIALQTAQSRYETAGQTLLRMDAQIAAGQAAVGQAQAGIDAADAQLRAATSASERISSLVKTKVASTAQLDGATEALDTATANRANALAALASAQAQVAVLTAQKAEAVGARHELELAVAQARRNLELTVLRAPSDGTVGNIAIETGDLVSPGARLAALIPSDGLYVSANYKETQMHQIADGEKVEVTFDALPGQVFEGSVASAAPATGSVFSLLPADNATGNFTKIVQRVPVRIHLPQEAIDSGALRVGLSAVVNIDSRTKPDASNKLAALATRG
jgi:membrane fusion protein, multidrug efflux system